MSQQVRLAVGGSVNGPKWRIAIWSIALYTVSTVSSGILACYTMGMYSIPGSLYTAGQLGMAGDIGIDRPLYNDRPIIFVVYYKYWSIALYTISTMSWGKMKCYTVNMYSIPGSLYTAGQLGIAGDIGIDDPVYNDRPMILVVYNKYWSIALYTVSTVSSGILACYTMGMYSIPGSLYTAGQLGMAGDIGMDEPFYNDQPIIFVVYYKNWSIALYTISTVSWGKMKCYTVDMYSIPGSLYTAGQLGIAGDIAIDDPFYNDRPMILVVYNKYWSIALYTISTFAWCMMACNIMGIYSIPGRYIQPVN